MFASTLYDTKENCASPEGKGDLRGKVRAFCSSSTWRMLCASTVKGSKRVTTADSVQTKGWRSERPTEHCVSGVSRKILCTNEEFRGRQRTSAGKRSPGPAGQQVEEEEERRPKQKTATKLSTCCHILVERAMLVQRPPAVTSHPTSHPWLKEKSNEKDDGGWRKRLRETPRLKKPKYGDIPSPWTK